MKRIFTVFILSIVFISLATPIHAGRKQEVLGVATPASEVNFPPVTSGPGIFLPGTLLFPLDQAFQAVRLALATDPISRARIHSSIAGERLAELRIMFERGDEEGIDTTLRLLTKEMNQAALKLSEAKANGASSEETQELAGELNEQLKIQRQILATLEDQTQNSLKLRVATARQQLREAKLEVEDSLPEGALKREIEAGLNEDLAENSQRAQQSVDRLQGDLEMLRLQLEESQIRNLEEREQVLERAISEREEQLQERGVDPIEEEGIVIEESDIEDALESVEEAQTNIEEIRQVVEEAQKLGRDSATFSN